MAVRVNWIKILLQALGIKYRGERYSFYLTLNAWKLWFTMLEIYFIQRIALRNRKLYLQHLKSFIITAGEFREVFSCANALTHNCHLLDLYSCNLCSQHMVYLFHFTMLKLWVLPALTTYMDHQTLNYLWAPFNSCAFWENEFFQYFFQ